MSWHTVENLLVVGALSLGVALCVGACALTYDVGKGRIDLLRDPAPVVEPTPSASSFTTNPPAPQVPSSIRLAKP